LFERAKKFRDAHSFEVNSYDEFKQKNEEAGGFLYAHWDGTRETEDRIAAETKATIRCIPLNRKKEPGTCMVTGKPSAGRVVFAKAYGSNVERRIAIMGAFMSEELGTEDDKHTLHGHHFQPGAKLEVIIFA